MNDDQAADAAAQPPEQTRQLYAGTCSGGPLDGQQYTVRYPEGFVAVHKGDRVAVVYDYDPTDATFDAREPEPLDDGRLYATVDEPRFDVVTYG